MCFGSIKKTLKLGYNKLNGTMGLFVIAAPRRERLCRKPALWNQKSGLNVFVIAEITFQAWSSLNVLQKLISVEGAPNGYVSVQVGSNVCFYISSTKIWPLPTGVNGVNNGEELCNKIGLPLAQVKTAKEHLALKNMTSNNKICSEKSLMSNADFSNLENDFLEISLLEKVISN